MAVDKFLMQEVIDRMIKYNGKYKEALENLNKEFPLQVEYKVLESQNDATTDSTVGEVIIRTLPALTLEQIIQK